MTPNEEMQAREFEAWATKELGGELIRDGHGGYNYPTANYMFAAWNAAHEAGRRQGLEEAAQFWRPMAEADETDDLEIIALATDGSVYRMETTTNHRGELRWQTWCGVGFVEGYISHFIPMPPIDVARPVKP